MSLQSILLRFALEAVGDLDVEDMASDVIKTKLKEHMLSKAQTIATEMRRKDMKLHAVPNSVFIRDALFRAWRKVIPWGPLADKIRDEQDDKIVEIVEAKIDPTSVQKQVVTWVIEEAVELAF